MTHERDILVRYGEIGTKGKNRVDFEKALAGNIRYALKKLEHGPVERPRGRIVVRDVEHPSKALKIITKIPGVISASPAIRSGLDMDTLIENALRSMNEALADHPDDRPVTFKVDATRSNKRFPLTSMELAAHLGAELIRKLPRLKAQMKEPDIRLVVEVRAREAFLSAAQQPGPGGLPVGSTGKVMVLLSGGIDSPVAAYLSMKRGARAYFINYHSYPFIPEGSLDKIKSVVSALCEFQGPSTLFVAPFADVQVAIKKNCDESLRTILYRRMMMRLAERAALEIDAGALVTGESLGQVASQTLENIGCIGAATRFPVFRPLIGHDKMETVELAKRIGTFDLSTQPFPDCCTVFQPRNPKIRAQLSDVERNEAHFDVEGLVEDVASKFDRLMIGK